MAERPSSSAHSDEPTEAALGGKAQALLDLTIESLQGLSPIPGAVDSRPQVTVKPSDVVEACRILKDVPGLSFNMLLCLAGVDYEERFEVVYVLLSLEHENTLVVKVELPYDDPRVPHRHAGLAGRRMVRTRGPRPVWNCIR